MKSLEQYIDYREYLKDYYADRKKRSASFSYRQFSQKAELLARAWVFATPSRFEGWCIAAAEAQACRVPVVATTADGFLDSVRDGETGILVPNDEQTVRSDLADAVSSLLADPTRRGAMGEAAHAWAARHTWEQLARMHEDFLLETVELNRRLAV